MTRTPKFEIDQAVYKWTGDYNGPGIVRGIIPLPDGRLRYLVGHRIEGGSGEFLHIYASGNLREIEGATGTIGLQCPGAVGTPPPDTELLDALCEAHRQVDSLLAHMIMMDDSFKPSKSPLWPEIVRRSELIQKLGGVV